MSKSFASIPFLFLSIVLFAVLTTRTLYIHNNSVLSRDSTQYILLAEEWIQNKEFPSRIITLNKMNDIPPLYLGIVYTATKFNVSSKNASIALNVGFFFIFVLLLYKMILLITRSKKIAAVVALCSIIHPTLLRYSCEAQRDMLYITLSTAFIYCCFNILKRNKTLDYMGCSLTVYLLLLTRYESLEFLCIIGFVFVYKIISCSLKTNEIAKIILFATELTILSIVSNKAFGNIWSMTEYYGGRINI